MKKFLIAVQIAAILMPISSVFANEIIKEKMKFEYYNEEEKEWQVKEEEIKFDGEDVIYEIDKKIINAGQESENKDINYILNEGYPRKSKEELNTNFDVEAYTATKLALVWTERKYSKDLLYERIREAENKDITNNEIENEETANLENNEEAINIEVNIVENIAEEQGFGNNEIENNKDQNEEVIKNVEQNKKDENIVENQNKKDEETKPELSEAVNIAYKILERAEEDKTKDEEEKIPEIDEKEEPKEEPEIPDEIIEEIKEEPNAEFKIESKNVISSDEELKYNVRIKNTGNTGLDKLKFYNVVDITKVKLTKMYVGTYNHETKYDVYYKTNQADNYILLEEDLDTKINNLIEFEKIKLSQGEKISEIKIEFKNVPQDFENVEDLQIFTKSATLKDNEKIKNYSILEAEYKDKKISEDIEKNTIIYNQKSGKKLPRTGH